MVMHKTDGNYTTDWRMKVSNFGRFQEIFHSPKRPGPLFNPHKSKACRGSFPEGITAEA